MCIVCNMGRDLRAVDTANEFLWQWRASGKAMAAAADAMLAVSRTAPSPVDRKRYDRLHKRMVKAIRDWNRLEEDREREAPVEEDGQQ